MNTVIRIALGITTLSCGFCIYLISDYRAKLKANQQQITHLTEAANDKAATNLDSAKKKHEQEINFARAQNAELKRRLISMGDSAKVARAALGEVTERMNKIQNNFGVIQVERDGYKEIVQTLDQLEKELVAYQALGTVAQLQTMKEQINRPKTTTGSSPDNSDPADDPAEGERRVKAKPGTQVGVVLRVDLRLGFYVINSGSNKGIVKGDEFHIHREGNFVGKIKVDEVRPLVSIATAIKKFTPKALQLGDKVVQGP